MVVCSGSLDDGVIYEQGGEKEMGSGQAWRHGGRRRRGSLAWWCLRRRTRNGPSGLSGLFLASGLGGSEGGMLQACAERRHRRRTAHQPWQPCSSSPDAAPPPANRVFTSMRKVLDAIGDTVFSRPISPSPPRASSPCIISTSHHTTPHYTTLHHPHPTKPNGGQFSPLIVHRSRGRQRTPDKTSGGARLPLGPTRGSSLRAGH